MQALLPSLAHLCFRVLAPLVAPAAAAAVAALLAGVACSRGRIDVTCLHCCGRNRRGP